MDKAEIAEGVRFVPAFNMTDQFAPSEELAVAIAQDTKTNEILKAAFASRAAVEKTLYTGMMTFCNPTRGIWTPGETTGSRTPDHPMMTEKVLVDCDQDAIIAKVNAPGDAWKGDFRRITNLDTLGGTKDESLIDMARVGSGINFFPQFNMKSPSSPTEELALAIAQDAETKEILMAAFASRAAVEKTLCTGRATFFSRKHGLWTKGESSGNTLDLQEMLTDRKQEAIIYMVRKSKGGACHTNKKDGTPRDTCFYREIGNLNLLKGKHDSLIDQAELSLIPEQE